MTESLNRVPPGAPTRSSISPAAPAARPRAFPTWKLVLDYWQADSTFQASVDNRADADEFVFYDGPPSPTDCHTMGTCSPDTSGRRAALPDLARQKVERRFGWDTHGLPAELEAERQLGITDKSEIETMGVEKFNDFCRDSVLRYTGEWRNYVTRQARWVDFDNDYKTLDLDFMESVMWAFKRLHDKGLIYQGYRVLPYSWYEQTPLSNQESKLDDAYRMRQDPALTVRMPIVEGNPLDGVNVVIWTTTRGPCRPTSRSPSTPTSSTST